MSGIVGIDAVLNRAVDRLDVAGRAAHSGQERVAQAAVAVVLVDRDLDQRVRRHLEDRRVLPLSLRVLGHVADPVREWVVAVGRNRLEREIGAAVAASGRRDRRGSGLQEEDEVDDDQRHQHAERRRDR